MVILAIFEMPGMTAGQYDEVDAALAEAGVREPEGRLQHVAAPTDDGWLVIDLWESEEQMGPFADVLAPVLEQFGVQSAEPRIYHVHNMIE